MRVLRLTEVVRAPTSIVGQVALDDLRFQFTVWYGDVDLDQLAATHGPELIDTLAFHVVLFQLNAAVSLHPDVIDLGPYAHRLTPELASLWQTVFHRVWAQWRFQCGRPDYVPRFAAPPVPSTARPGRVADGSTELLAFCGGGKDSLVALRLLERAQLSFATLAYSHSIYGRAAPQHALIERVARVTGRAGAHQLSVIDDLLDSPAGAHRGEPLLAAETPASLFAALPVALAHGYRGLVVAHEASANTPTIASWNGEAINHQWGKSWDAEQLLARYVREHLLANVDYFSVLAPVHDEVILELLARDAALAPLTHSCNVDKPWCGRCAKCVYVWLQFAAHLPPDVVTTTFGTRVNPDAALDQLLGFANHAPFDCVGSVDEARLAYHLARARGAIAALPREVPTVDPRPFLHVGTTHGMPAHVAARVMPLLDEAARAAANRLGTEQ